jgi:hypothetical protein
VVGPRDLATPDVIISDQFDTTKYDSRKSYIHPRPCEDLWRRRCASQGNLDQSISMEEEGIESTKVLESGVLWFARVNVLSGMLLWRAKIVSALLLMVG